MITVDYSWWTLIMYLALVLGLGIVKRWVHLIVLNDFESGYGDRSTVDKETKAEILKDFKMSLAIYGIIFTSWFIATVYFLNYLWQGFHKS